jgi:hypothetical protein
MWWCEIYSSWITPNVCSQSFGDEVSLPQAVEMARQDWVYAKRYFNAVTEPELLDYAIYMIKATEVKYIYLLKKAKKEDIKFCRYMQCEN